MWASSCLHGSLGDGQDVVSNILKLRIHIMLKMQATGHELKSGVEEIVVRFLGD